MGGNGHSLVVANELEKDFDAAAAGKRVVQGWAARSGGGSGDVEEVVGREGGDDGRDHMERKGEGHVGGDEDGRDEEGDEEVGNGDGDGSKGAGYTDNTAVAVDVAADGDGEGAVVVVDKEQSWEEEDGGETRAGKRRKRKKKQGRKWKKGMMKIQRWR